MICIELNKSYEFMIQVPIIADLMASKFNLPAKPGLRTKEPSISAFNFHDSSSGQTGSGCHTTTSCKYTANGTFSRSNSVKKPSQCAHLKYFFHIRRLGIKSLSTWRKQSWDLPQQSQKRQSISMCLQHGCIYKITLIQN